MIQYQVIGRAVLLAAGVFLAAGVNAQQPQAAPKASEPAQPPGKEAAPAVKPVLEPKALDLLKAMSDRLLNRSFSCRLTSTRLRSRVEMIMRTVPQRMPSA